MRKLIYLIIALILPLNSLSQKKRILFFEKYTPGHILLLNKSIIKVSLNYDASNKQLMYLEGSNEMILTNNNSVDTVYIDTHKFIYRNNSYLEYIQSNHGSIFINWFLKDVFNGYRGIYGQTTQNRIERINTAYWEQGKYENQSAEIHAINNNNKYSFFINGKEVICCNKKDLLNLFKIHKEEINKYVNENNLDFKKTSDALNVIDYCLSLK